MASWFTSGISMIQVLFGVDGTEAQPIRTDSNGNVGVGGGVAAGATDSGNPVKIGTKFNTSLPSPSDGQRVDAQSDTNGALVVSLVPGNKGIGSSALNTDGASAAINGLRSYSITGAINGGGTIDRWRNNMDGTGLASAARTATTNSGDLTNYNATAVHVVLDVTTAGTGSITLTIQGKDALSGQYYTLLAGAAVTTISTNVYKVMIGGVVSANVSANDLVPRTWRILVTHNNANSITYSVGYSLIVA